MLAARDLHRMPLISLTDGKKVGEIRDVYLDPEANGVSAVLVGWEGLLHRKPMIVDRAAIQVCGVDAWLVTGPDVVVELAEGAGLPKLILAEDLRGREVTTEGGTKIGTLNDILLDGEAQVIGFGLGRTYLQGPLAERRYIARAAVVNMGMKSTNQGHKDQPMIVDLAKAETLNLPAQP